MRGLEKNFMGRGHIYIHIYIHRQTSRLYERISLRADSLKIQSSLEKFSHVYDVSCNSQKARGGEARAGERSEGGGVLG